ncbi:2-deoxystreptamine N-acetyl-D-glucosaminyltransferase [Roseimaritima multifibrata]|uniref:2-deoxystreptamine N-acetyl-D-glucosaminyltransferase n=1 Tax=Roseimaritima multifibrata TaxID=1930274 RepID=A0A517MLT0_9BACT|nr:glycosyltransferase family 4 protein [Roseimaritima multifibrata]QDS95810.1 2-deoxystreptamine N-acetyl-D-glucosaminyltransferase [Roseimaritima multifibrata]
MRIAHVITRMIVGGAQENTLLTCHGLLRDYGDDVLLLTGPSLGPEGGLLEQGRVGELPTKELPMLRRAIHPLNDAKALAALKAALRDFKPDVVHTHSAKGGILGRQAAWALKVPAILHTVHGAPFYPYQPAPIRWFYRKCERRAAKQCHRLISVADAMTDLMVEGGVADRSKFTTVYSGMDVAPFLAADKTREQTRKKLGIQPDDIVIGKIARLFHLKGHDDLIHAASRVLAEHPKVKFLLVGDGVLREELEKKISSLGLTDRFLLTGLVPPVEIPSLIGAMDALVHTSYREGLARALPQALIAGKPVVSYDVDGAREVVINDETGFLVPAGGIDELARRLIQIAGDPQLRLRLGATGRERFTEPFQAETMTRRLREIYEELLK